MGMQYAAV